MGGLDPDFATLAALPSKVGLGGLCYKAGEARPAAPYCGDEPPVAGDEAAQPADDVFGDGCVMRTVVKPPLGPEYADGHEDVVITLETRADDGALLLNRPEGFEYSFGSGQCGALSKALDKVLLDMRKGEEILLRCTGDYCHSEQSSGGLTAKLGLLELCLTKDISRKADSSLIKKRIREGCDTESPKETSNVEVRVLAAATVPECSAAEAEAACASKSLHFVLGNGDVCDVLELAAARMQKGEQARVCCSGDGALLAGLARDLGLSGSGLEKVSVTLELSDFSKTAHSWEMSLEQKLAFARGRKEAGGNIFKQGRYEMALQRYSLAIALLRSLEDLSGSAEKDAAELMRLCQLNVAACQLKLEDYSAARGTCDGVLEVDRNNVKALFRRASAEFQLGAHTDAAADARRVLELDATNADARKLLQQLQALRKKEDTDSQSMYAGMCKGFGTPGLFPEKAGRPLTDAEEEINRLANLPSGQSLADLCYKPGEVIPPNARELAESACAELNEEAVTALCAAKQGREGLFSTT
eukprot:TRINITY_DN101822_c0_g1_i1.p1 TRINITY_DN101822_c0_g1~~TRINITY_DN101822_c0_g1_i1.p1  ORF type:complete len:530 (-),score=171.93 TRINITY_DN101822_c0_g1_i1:266-1855(-)